MKILSFFLTFLFMLPIIAEKKPERLKSRIYFYKNVSEDDINGWEKDFFKDHFADEPMSFPDADILTDNDIDDEDTIKTAPSRVNRKSINKFRVLKKQKIIRKIPDNEPDLQPHDMEETPEIDTFETPDIEVLKIKKEKKRVISDINNIIPETVDEDNGEIPDNEVDRSSRIRKMKKLLKKRKGKRRIDKRRIY